MKNKKKIGSEGTLAKLQKEKEEVKKSANHYLTLCSQLAEEVIVLRSKLDKLANAK